MTSRLKIALLSAFISGVVLVGFGAVMWWRIYDLRVAAVDQEIRALATRHPGLWAGRGSFERLAASLELTYGSDHTNRVILQIRDISGATAYQSAHWPAGLDEKLPESGPVTNSAPPVLADVETGRGRGGRGFGVGRGGPPSEVVFTRPPQFSTVSAADSTWRVGVLGNDELTFILGLNHDEVQGELNAVRNLFLLTLPLVLLLVGGGGWLVAGRALRPLTTIADTAERITARGLDQRIPQPTENPEAARVIQVLNRMMDRLESSFRQATRFSADASHELKTPLAVMQGELENALQAAVPGSPAQQLFANLLEETQRLTTITRSLLLLAQADAGQLPLARQPVDLRTVIADLVEDAHALAADGRLTFDVHLDSDPKVEADAALLRTALFNLLKNAIKYNEPEGRIEVRLAASPDAVQLSVANTGPGIPPADQARIFERFFRSERARSKSADGLGLGLSLAREILRAHGGDLTLQESRPGWTVFTATLPAK
jgi:heavy metal sensor kinase